MTIQVSAIQFSSTLLAEGYSAYIIPGNELVDTLLTVSTVPSTASIQPLIGVYTTSGPAVLAIAKIRSALTAEGFYPLAPANVFDGLISVPRIYAVGATPGTNLEITVPPRRPPYILIPTLPADVYTGLGVVVSVLPIQSSSFTMFPDIFITFNFIKTPTARTEGLENRQNIKIVDDQKSGAEAGSSKEYTLELTRLEQEDLTIDNTQANLRKRTAATILAGNKSKDRRNIINSIVNNYSKATKRS